MTEQQLLRMAKPRLAILCRQDCPGHSHRTDRDAARQGRKQSIPCHDGDQPLPTTLGAGRHASLRSRRISCRLAKGSRCARPGCSFTITGWLLGGSVDHPSLGRLGRFPRRSSQ